MTPVLLKKIENVNIWLEKLMNEGHKWGYFPELHSA